MIIRAPVVLPDGPTADPCSDQVKDLRPTHVLADSELRHELPTDSRARVLLDRNVKASFSVDETGYLGIQPFLLIGRTCRIVTAPDVHDDSPYVRGVAITLFGGE